MQHSREIDGDDADVKIIGVFSTEHKGRAAIAELCKQPGFVRCPDGFALDRYELDRLWWAEGFATIDGERDDDDENQ